MKTSCKKKTKENEEIPGNLKNVDILHIPDKISPSYNDIFYKANGKVRINTPM